MFARATAGSDAVKGEKPHFVVLDGLRGVAALCVVIYHFGEIVITDYTRLWIAHGFLAVDFFFCLSGFVLGYAYDGRIEKIGFGRFLKSRLIRLQPLVVLGSVLGLLTFYASPHGSPFGTPSAYSVGRLLLIFAASICVIPFGTMRERNQNLFGLNAPAWSLFWEYLASIAFGLLLFRARRGVLAMLALVGAVWLCWAGYHTGDLSGGWSTGTFLDGGARVLFSFSTGLLVYRSRWRPRIALGFSGLAMLLFLALITPYQPHDWLRETVLVVLLFPLVVALGAGASVTPRAERVCRWLGDLSYPLYMTHYCVIWIWGALATAHPQTPARLWSEIALGTLCMVGVAFAALKWYDEPVRAYLRCRIA